MDQVMGFEYVDLKNVDPNFTLLDGPEVYSFRITKAEMPTYIAKKDTATQKAGDEVKYIKFTFTVVDHPKYTGRKHWEPLFGANDFNIRILKRIEEATGVVQGGSLASWLEELSTIQPVVKLQIDKVPDGQTLQGVFTPNPGNVNADGSARDKNVVNWKSGVSPA
jgi:hypothetical protein